MKNNVKLSGSALIEGVMIKNEGQYAMALRKGNSDIEIVHDVYKGILGRGSFSKIPILRGIFALIDYLGLGIKSILFSSDFYEDNSKEEPGAIQRFLKKFTGKYHESFELITCITIALILSIGLFIVAPYMLAGVLADLVIPSSTLMTVLEILLRVIMIVAYIVLIVMNKDVRRICRYHGAQHKVINCLNNGEELTINNVRRASKYDKDCELNFIIGVFGISLIVFAFIRSSDIWLRMALRVIIIPIVAAILYEIMLITNKAASGAGAILQGPQKFLQKLLVTEPTDDMLEVAIESLQAVFDWRDHLGLPPEGEERKTYEIKGGAGAKDVGINSGININSNINNGINNNMMNNASYDNSMMQGSMYDNNYYNTEYDNTAYDGDSYDYNLNNQPNYNNLSYDEYNNGQYFVESDGAHNPQYTDLGNVVTRQSLDEGITKQPEYEQADYNMPNQDYNNMYGEYMQNNGYNNNYNNGYDYNNMQYNNGQQGNMYNQGNYGNGYNEQDDLKMLDRYFTDDNY